jgi:hypothetical protein
MYYVIYTEHKTVQIPPAPVYNNDNTDRTVDYKQHVANDSQSYIIHKQTIAARHTGI